MNINIITVGKLKEEYLKAACNEYCKRLQAFGKLNIIEINEYKLPNNPPQKEITKALSVEGSEIARYSAGKDCYTIALCIEGTKVSSEKFAEKIAGLFVAGKSMLNIIIGSSYGIAAQIKNSADFRLSLSDMTFPHQLARVMLLEQVYRAFMILNDGKYHK